MDKDTDAFRTISEVAEDLDLPQHVLRFWETRFAQIKPLKRGGGRRYYRPDDVALVRSIRHLLYGEGYTIKGVQRILKEQGVRALITMANGISEGRAVSHGAPSGLENATSGLAEAAVQEERAAPAGPSAASREQESHRGMLLAVLAELDECSRILSVAAGGSS